MYKELIYFENGRQIARVFFEFNEHKDNSDPEVLWSELKTKIEQKEKGNHRWDWKEELKKSFKESFPYLQHSEE